MIDAYPLQWPAGWARTEEPVQAKFKTPFSYARDGLLRELDLLGATNIVISTNMMVRTDGLLYVKQRMPDDRGVASTLTGTVSSNAFHATSGITSKTTCRRSA